VATTPQCNTKLKLDYPTKWNYKLVIHSQVDIQKIIDSVLGDRVHKLEASKSSKNGKYKSYNISLLVHNEDDRQMLYESFKKDDNVKIVL